MDNHKWVRAARKHAKLTQDQLAEKMEMTKGNISGWENGHHSPSFVQMKKVSSITNFPLPLEGLPGAAPIESNVTDAPALGPSRMVPVVGHVKGGVDGFLEEMQYPVGHGEGFVEYWTKDPEAYALRVKGDSMHPRYRAGEFIIVTPSIEPQPGRDVMVKLKSGMKLLKQLNWRRGDEIQLLSINDGYEPYTVSMDEIESIQRVAGGVPSDAFEEARSH